MAASALMIEFLFAKLGLIPKQRKAYAMEASISWNYTTWLNIAFLGLAAVLLWRCANGRHRDVTNDEQARARRQPRR
jgi:uncharacterized membrane protein YraQ (UPF0718 family)